MDKLHLADQKHSVAVKVSGLVRMRTIPQPRFMSCWRLLAGGARMSIGVDWALLHPYHAPTLQSEPRGCLPRGSPSLPLWKQLESGSEQTAQAASEPGCWTTAVITTIKINLSPVIENLPGLHWTLTTILLILWHYCPILQLQKQVQKVQVNILLCKSASTAMAQS